VTLKFAGGEHVVKQGEHADAIYIIKEGKVGNHIAIT
jgi:CRP-like cAMP-binding protein